MDSIDEYESLSAAGARWDEYKELGKSAEAALAIAEKQLSKVMRGRGKCWLTVAEFDDATVDKWVKIALDRVRTFIAPLGVQLPVTAQGLASKTSVLAHEQGHFDITEAFARVFRAELKTMRATVYSRMPSTRLPNQYREVAVETLRAQWVRRSAALARLMNGWPGRCHSYADTISGSIPELQRIVERGEVDPNCIMEPPVYPGEADPMDVCGNGIVRTVVQD